MLSGFKDGFELSSSSTRQLPLWLVLGFSWPSCPECQCASLLTRLPLCTSASLPSSGKVCPHQAELVLTGACWTLLGAYSSKTLLWHWEGCQVCEKWHQVCTFTSTWSLRNCSPDYLVLPSAWTGWVVDKGVVNKELILAVLKVFVAQVLSRQQVRQTQVGFAYLCSWKASCPKPAAICAFCLQPSAFPC